MICDKSLTLRCLLLILQVLGMFPYRLCRSPEKQQLEFSATLFIWCLLLQMLTSCSLYVFFTQVLLKFLQFFQDIGNTAFIFTLTFASVTCSVSTFLLFIKSHKLSIILSKLLQEEKEIQHLDETQHAFQPETQKPNTSMAKRHSVIWEDVPFVFIYSVLHTVAGFIFFFHHLSFDVPALLRWFFSITLSLMTIWSVVIQNLFRALCLNLSQQLVKTAGEHAAEVARMLTSWPLDGVNSGPLSEERRLLPDKWCDMLSVLQRMECHFKEVRTHT